AGPASAATQAMENFVYVQGKAVLLVHAAAAYIPCPDLGSTDVGHPDCRFLARAAVRQYQQGLPNATARVYADSVFAGQVPPYGSLGAPDNLGPVPTAAIINHGRRN